MTSLMDFFKSKAQLQIERKEHDAFNEKWITEVEPILKNVLERCNHSGERSRCKLSEHHLINLVFESYAYGKDVWRYCVTLADLHDKFDYPAKAPPIKSVLLLSGFSSQCALTLAPEDIYGRKKVRFTDSQKEKFLKIVRMDYGPGLDHGSRTAAVNSVLQGDPDLQRFDELRGRVAEVRLMLEKEESQAPLFFGVEKSRKSIARLKAEVQLLVQEIDKLKPTVNKAITSYGHSEDWWRSLRGVALETALTRLLQDHGIEVKGTPTSGDGGIDLVFKFQNRSYLVQCKGWADKVGVATVREMAGVLSRAGSDTKGLIVAPNGFTEGAIKFAVGSDIRVYEASNLVRFETRSFIS
jgi:hypothetical protein